MGGLDWFGTFSALANAIFGGLLVFWAFQAARVLGPLRYWQIYGLAIVGLYLFVLYLMIAIQEVTNTFISSSMTVFVRPALTAFLGIAISGLIQMARGIKQ